VAQHNDEAAGAQRVRDLSVVCRRGRDRAERMVASPNTSASAVRVRLEIANMARLRSFQRYPGIPHIVQLMPARGWFIS
jgi:hypothetical protein